MRHHFLLYKAAGEGIAGSSDIPQDVMQDSTTPQSRSDLVSQAFFTNTELGDPTSEASPAAVNPVLSGSPMVGMDMTSDDEPVNDGEAAHDVLAAYDAGRMAALEKYAFRRASGSHLPNVASTSTSAGGTPKAQATIPNAPSQSAQVRDSTANLNQGLARNHAQDFGTDVRTPAQSDTPIGAGFNSAQVFKPTTGPGAFPEQPKKASLEVRNDYGKKEPTRYSIPADNGANYSPKTNLDEKPERSVQKAFNDLATQRNADTLNEAGQASIGSLGL